MVKEKKTSHKKRGKQKKRNNNVVFFRQTLNWIVIFTFLLSVILPLSFVLIYRQKIYPNIMTGSLNLSSKTVKEAEDYLNNTYKNLENTDFYLTYDGKEWVFPAKSWGIKMDSQKTVDNAYRIGRNVSFFKNIATLFRAQKETIKIPLDITFDEALFASSAGKISDEINIPVINPAIIVEKNKIAVIPGSIGRKLDEAMLKNKIIETISNNNSYNIILPVISLKPEVSPLEEKQTGERAKNILPKKVTVIIGENYYDLQNQELINLLSFSGGFDGEKIASLAANFANAYDTKPQNAAFNFENGRVTMFKPGKEGQQINQEKTIPLLNNELTLLEATVSAKITVNIPTVLTPPEIKTNEVNDLGIKELLGKGISYFRGSIASRIHNINLASSRINGLLIKPGETFSFNKALGDVSQATGFQQAYVIQNGRTVLGDGGGVCQVSTTLFRAALNAGLPITERQAHAYRVAYYEQGFGAGLDATVFDPTADLKFQNDTPAHILIQTNVDLNNLILTFELYGTSDARKAFISTPKIWDQTPPPPPKYEDDPTMLVGTEKQVDWAAWGAKTSFDYKVVRNGETLINKTFYSNFRPWQAVYLRGTKQ